MERHYSFGTAELVALMAAHRAAMARLADQFDQSLSTGSEPLSKCPPTGRAALL